MPKELQLPEPFEYNTDLLKEQMPTYVERNLQDRISSNTPTSYSLHCPVHGEDNNPSCSIDNKKGPWLYHCFADGCGSSGTLLDLNGAIESLEPWSAENFASLTEKLGLTFDDVKATVDCKYRKTSGATTTQPQPSPDDNLTKKIREEFATMIGPFIHDMDKWRDNLIKSSPHLVESPKVSSSHDLINHLFREDDIIWMGDQWDSGSPEHAANFRTRQQWSQEDQLPPRIAAGTFQPGSTSRSSNGLLTSPFIVIESDGVLGGPPAKPAENELNKCLSAALIGYVQTHLGLTLRAVIDTGNKSLHAWFDRPDENEFLALRTMAEGLRIDRGVLDRAPTLPLRTPGCIHEKTNVPASLLYLNPISK